MRRAIALYLSPLLFLLGSFADASADALSEKATTLLEQRCMVCHGCYDAPCQLKLEAHEGLVRGGTDALVYDGARLRAANLTRLFDDATSEQGWREKGFHPVLDPDNPRDGVMYRTLALKQAHPLPQGGSLREHFDFSLYREQQCPKQEEFDQFARDNPLWGMPYGLPGLNKGEHTTLINWLEAGAKAPSLDPITVPQQTLLDDWEQFLNAGDNKSRLMSRYLYEHLFLANLYLEAADNPAWFRLVRSRTAPGEPVEVIASRRPYDDPGVRDFYYRLQRMPVAALAKTHMPYRFDRARMDLYRKLFIDAGYEVDQLPGYDPEVGSNPFKSFVAIPVSSRYRFLLAEAQFTIMNFIKGPVCRGQVALNVIDDHFWVMFASPDQLDPEEDAQFLAREMDNLRLPKPRTGTVIDLFTWRGYAKANRDYQAAKSEYIKQKLGREHHRLNLDFIWDGDGHNDNAALTIFRHFDTASVVKGFVGETPKTAWFIGYTLLERIHYLLVAGFDVYGAVAHQLESRLYMDFLRMEGEFNFLAFLPPEERAKLRDHWYRGARKRVKDHFAARTELTARLSDIHFETDDPKEEFLAMAQQRIYGADAKSFDYRSSASSDMIAAFEGLEQAVGAHNDFMPQTSFVNVIGPTRDEVYTIVRNSGYANIAQIFQEDKRRLPGEDSLTIVRGFLGAYPNYFFQINEQQVSLFASELKGMKTERDFNRLKERYGVRRNVPWFWRLSDKLHAQYREQDPVEFGVFDYNRYSGD